MDQQPNWPSKLTVDQYHELIRIGSLTDDDRVELLEGSLVRRMRKSPTHSMATRLTLKVLESLALVDSYVEVHGPITLQESEPEPDVAVVRGDPCQYPDRHPGAQDVALIVEVADLSLQRDRTLKKRLYAQASIPVYWIINLSDRQLEVYTEPSGPAEEPDYRQRQD
jgi:Uma2 family endonuclease